MSFDVSRAGTNAAGERGVCCGALGVGRGFLAASVQTGASSWTSADAHERWVGWDWLRQLDWWNAGYVNNANTLIGERFRTEATVSLPGIIEAPSPETIFDGMEFQRLWLHHDQQVPEWE